VAQGAKHSPVEIAISVVTGNRLVSQVLCQDQKPMKLGKLGTIIHEYGKDGNVEMGSF